MALYGFYKHSISAVVTTQPFEPQERPRGPQGGGLRVFEVEGC